LERCGRAASVADSDAPGRPHRSLLALACIRARLSHMSDEEQIICDVCRQRPSGTGRDRHLCLPCFEQTASPAELDFFRQSTDALRQAKCKYCGAPAIGGSTGLSIPGVMEQQSDFWCEPCRLDLVEFGSRPENEIPDFPFDNEAAQALVPQQLADYEHRKAEFMRQRVKERSR
jgi:hypothetical protein